MYEVFINHHCLRLTNSRPKYGSNTPAFDADFNWFEWFLEIEHKTPQTLTMYAENLEDAWRLFQSQFLLLRAAGGLVVNNQRLLFIFRNGKWDLPKGKMEMGESVDETALREVQEECGIVDLCLNQFLTKTFHVYCMNNRWVLKETDWFLMQSSQDNNLTPQLEEGIDLVKWVSPEAIDEYLNNSFETISRVIQSYLRLKETPSGKN